MGLIREKANKWGVTEKAASVIVVIVLVFAAFMLFEGGFKVRFDETSFQVQATFWSDMTIDYADVSSVTWRDDDKPGSRANGYGSLKLLMGTFDNEEFGRYERYSYVGCKSAVVLQTTDGTLVLGGQNEAETRKLYDELIARTEEN